MNRARAWLAAGSSNASPLTDVVVDGLGHARDGDGDALLSGGGLQEVSAAVGAVAADEDDDIDAAGD